MVTKPMAITPRWLTFKAAAKYTGVSTRTLENWEKAGCFRVARVTAPGCSKGTRLIDREELDAHILQFIGAPPRELTIAVPGKGGRRK